MTDYKKMLKTMQNVTDTLNEKRYHLSEELEELDERIMEMLEMEKLIEELIKKEKVE